jgi:hypothetical protein
MPETYPADADLNALGGTADPEQEVLYIPAGQSPYYTSFYKMLYRLLDVARRAGDLRVYKDGDLTFGVRPGRMLAGDSEVAFAGAADQPLTNNAENSIYLTAAAELIVSTAGFPVPSLTPHIRLAVITTSAGGYDHSAVVDRRGGALFRPAGEPGRSPVAHTSDHTVAAADSGRTFTNEGAAAAVTFTLPPATPGLTFTFVRQEAVAGCDVRVAPDGDEHIFAPDGADCGPGAWYGNEADAFGLVRLACVSAGQWRILDELGTWTAAA